VWSDRWQAFQRRGILIHYIVLFTVIGALPLVFLLATLGAHLTWILTMYFDRRFFSQSSEVNPTVSKVKEAFMKAVILAAGQGNRIRSVHGEHPKCLIEVDNATILDHQLKTLSMAGINDVAIVVGYEKEQIINHVMSRKLSDIQRIHFIENPAFCNY